MSYETKKKKIIKDLMNRNNSKGQLINKFKTVICPMIRNIKN